MFKCLIALTTLFSLAASAATVWTWVDGNGVRHYSDTEVPGATPLELQGAQTFSGSAFSPPAEAAATTTGESPAAGYSTLEIFSPAADETIRNIEGNLPVEVGTVPQLANDHFIDVVLDGVRLGLNLRSLNFTVPEVWRGSHSLQAVIVDGADEILITSAPVTFFVQQSSSLTQPGSFPSLGR